MTRRTTPTRKVSTHIMLPVDVDRLLTELANNCDSTRSDVVEALIVREGYATKTLVTPKPT